MAMGSVSMDSWDWEFYNRLFSYRTSTTSTSRNGNQLKDNWNDWTLNLTKHLRIIIYISIGTRTHTHMRIYVLHVYILRHWQLAVLQWTFIDNRPRRFSASPNTDFILNAIYIYRASDYNQWIAHQNNGNLLNAVLCLTSLQLDIASSANAKSDVVKESAEA